MITLCVHIFSQHEMGSESICPKTMARIILYSHMWHTCRKSPISKEKSLQCKFKCGYKAKSNCDVNRHGNEHCVLNPDCKVKCRQCNMFIAQSEIA